MKICFVHNDEERERNLAHAFCAGAEKHGHRTQQIVKTAVLETDADVVCMVGVKSAKLFEQARKQKKTVLFFDKGYFRHRGPNRTWEFWRIAVNDHHPSAYLEKACHKPQRWDALAKARNTDLKPWRNDGEHIIYLGSSAKYHAIAGLEDPHAVAQETVNEIRKYTDRPIYYRPKPSFHDARPVEGAYFDQGGPQRGTPQRSIDKALKGAWCVVTHGSNACFESVLEGIPCIVLHDAIAKPISSHTLKDIPSPYLAQRSEVLQWLYNLAWCMFTEVEMESGLAWQVIEPRIKGNRYVEEEKLDTIVGKLYEPDRIVKERQVAEKRRLKRLRSQRKRRKSRRK
jgi:hypothetical protein